MSAPRERGLSRAKSLGAMPAAAALAQAAGASAVGHGRTISVDGTAAGETAPAGMVGLEAINQMSTMPVIPRASVVKIFVVCSPPNYSMPWQQTEQLYATGSGFVLSLQHRLILTNAHVVYRNTQIRIRKLGSHIRFPAAIQSVGYESDLAVLRVDDESFWEGLQELSFGDVPSLQEAVTVVGYPLGGDNISVTRGVVSRIDLTQYLNRVADRMLAIQIDAAINPGNSGGPVFDDQGNVVGVAFSGISAQQAENIGYIIPFPIIRQFLHSVERSTERNVPKMCRLGFTFQTLENPDFRRHLGLRLEMSTQGVDENANASEETLGGVLIKEVEELGPCKGVLHPGDVLLSVDGNAVASDATIKFRKEERILFSHLIKLKHQGDPVEYRVFRDRQLITVTGKAAPVPYLVPIADEFDCNPQFYTVGGMVFGSLSQPLIDTFGSNGKFMTLKLENQVIDPKKHEDQELVCLLTILPHDCNFGYELGEVPQVLKFNGESIRNLEHLARMVEETTSEWLEFTIDSNARVVIRTETARAADAEIMQQYGVSCKGKLGGVLGPGSDFAKKLESMRLEPRTERAPARHRVVFNMQ